MFCFSRKKINSQHFLILEEEHVNRQTHSKSRCFKPQTKNKKKTWKNISLCLLFIFAKAFRRSLLTQLTDVYNFRYYMYVVGLAYRHAIDISIRASEGSTIILT